MVSLFINRYDNQKICDSTTEKVLKSIQNPTNFHREKVLRIRELADKDLSYDFLKSQLPVILWAGIFESLKVKSLKKASNLLYVDVDKQVVDLSLIKQIPYVVASWRSCSGKGTSIIVKSDKLTRYNYKATYHKFAKLLEQYGIEADKGASNMNRANAASFDTNLFYNPNAEIFDSVEVKYHQPEPLEFDIKNHVGVCQKIETNVKYKFGPYKKGNRHNFVYEFLIRAMMANVEKHHAKAYLINKGYTEDLERNADRIYRDYIQYKGNLFIPGVIKTNL